MRPVNARESNAFLNEWGFGASRGHDANGPAVVVNGSLRISICEKPHAGKAKWEGNSRGSDGIVIVMQLSAKRCTDNSGRILLAAKASNRIPCPTRTEIKPTSVRIREKKKQ